MNKNFEDIATDIKEQANRVNDLITKNPQPSEIIDARIDYENRPHSSLRELLVGEQIKVANIMGEIEGTTKISELTSPQYLAHRGSSFL
ncbi:hypothetical protein ABZ737_33735, partial [Streptomyces sp. NPDC013087]|uniref:hypothetical protein n=1 Tax=Streptomyces sp. NPDC013087 TaxID=3156694 RepID=UPI0033D0DF7B